MVQVQTGGSVDGETELAVMDTPLLPATPQGTLKV